MRLLAKTLTAFLLGLLITGTMLFLPAGTLAYSRGWLFLGLLFIPILIVGVTLLIKDPELLLKRLEMKENEKVQQGIVTISGLSLIASFIVAGLDFRYGWSHMTNSIVAIASIILLVGYALYAEVLRENIYLSRVIEVQAGQHVVDTGLYAIVRHPMYFSVTLRYLAIPIVLGSWWALIAISPCIFLLVSRIRNEEKVLLQDLPGYTAYIKRVRYRMIPFIW